MVGVPASGTCAPANQSSTPSHPCRAIFTRLPRREMQGPIDLELQSVPTEVDSDSTMPGDPIEEGIQVDMDSIVLGNPTKEAPQADPTLPTIPMLGDPMEGSYRARGSSPAASTALIPKFPCGQPKGARIYCTCQDCVRACIASKELSPQPARPLAAKFQCGRPTAGLTHCKCPDCQVEQVVEEVMAKISSKKPLESPPPQRMRPWKPYPFIDLREVYD